MTFDPDIAVEFSNASKPIGVADMFKSNDLLPPHPRMALAELSLYHRNPRVSNMEVLKQSLLANGQYKPVVVNKGTHTGRSNEVLAGNHTIMAMRELAEEQPGDSAWVSALVHVIDVDEATAARIVAVDNRTGDLGKYQDELLAELLESIPDLTGTGYTDEDLAKMLGNNVIEGDADTTETARVFGVIVDCDSEAQQVSLLERLEVEGFNVRALM